MPSKPEPEPSSPEKGDLISANQTNSSNATSNNNSNSSSSEECPNNTSTNTIANSVEKTEEKAAEQVKEIAEKFGIAGPKEVLGSNKTEGNPLLPSPTGGAHGVVTPAKKEDPAEEDNSKKPKKEEIQQAINSLRSIFKGRSVEDLETCEFVCLSGRDMFERKLAVLPFFSETDLWLEYLGYVKEYADGSAS